MSGAESSKGQASETESGNRYSHNSSSLKGDRQRMRSAAIYRSLSGTNGRTGGAFHADKSGYHRTGGPREKSEACIYIKGFP